MPNDPDKLRYDPDENVSRHAAVDDECCYEMESSYGWKLKRIEKINADILKADCVFESETEFPDWYKEQERMEDK